MYVCLQPPVKMLCVVSLLKLMPLEKLQTNEITHLEEQRLTCGDLWDSGHGLRPGSGDVT